MSDPMNEIQEMSVVEEYSIPSREEHNRFIRRIWKICFGMALAVFLLTGTTVLTLFLKGYDSKKVVEVSTSIFQVLVLSYGLAFFVPAFLTSLIKMSLGVDMSRIGIHLGNKTAGILERVDKAIDERLVRLDKILSTAETPETHPMFKEAKQAALDIRKEVSTLTGEVRRLADAYTRPIVSPKKPEMLNGSACKTDGNPAKDPASVLRA